MKKSQQKSKKPKCYDKLRIKLNDRSYKIFDLIDLRAPFNFGHVGKFLLASKYSKFIHGRCPRQVSTVEPI